MKGKFVKPKIWLKIGISLRLITQAMLTEATKWMIWRKVMISLFKNSFLKKLFLVWCHPNCLQGFYQTTVTTGELDPEDQELRDVAIIRIGFQHPSTQVYKMIPETFNDKLCEKPLQFNLVYTLIVCIFLFSFNWWTYGHHNGCKHYQHYWTAWIPC